MDRATLTRLLTFGDVTAEVIKPTSWRCNIENQRSRKNSMEKNTQWMWSMDKHTAWRCSMEKYTLWRCSMEKQSHEGESWGNIHQEGSTVQHGETNTMQLQHGETNTMQVQHGEAYTKKVQHGVKQMLLFTLSQRLKDVKNLCWHKLFNVLASVSWSIFRQVQIAIIHKIMRCKHKLHLKFVTINVL